jgi:hypothetical protein
MGEYILLTAYCFTVLIALIAITISIVAGNVFTTVFNVVCTVLLLRYLKIVL